MRRPTARGRFITVEGGEGAGKSTQAARLAASLEARGVPVLVTREPGGSPEAERIRALLLGPGAAAWEATTEVLLYFAGRVENVAKTVEPALAAGRAVVCDRFADSTLAYQGYGDGAPVALIRAIADAALGGFEPDLTLVLDIDPAEGIERIRARSPARDRYETRPLDYHRRVREGFLEIAARAPGRCAVIDAAASEDAVAGAVLAAVLGRFADLSGRG